MNVQVILNEDVPNLGRTGDVVKVRPGFARNYLVPRGLAVGATAGNVARIEHQKKVAEAKAAKHESNVVRSSGRWHMLI